MIQCIGVPGIPKRSPQILGATVEDLKSSSLGNRGLNRCKIITSRGLKRPGITRHEAVLRTNFQARHDVSHLK
jgi:hypothetical protein